MEVAAAVDSAVKLAESSSVGSLERSELRSSEIRGTESLVERLEMGNAVAGGAPVGTDGEPAGIDAGPETDGGPEVTDGGPVGTDGEPEGTDGGPVEVDSDRVEGLLQSKKRERGDYFTSVICMLLVMCLST